MPPPSPEPPDFAASQLFLRRLAYSLVRDAAQAEDLVQDTWAAWIEHRPSGVAEPRAWLARVLRNRAFNLKRGDARRARRETLAGRADPSEPETEGTLEAQSQLLEALRRLEEPYRSTLVQRYYHDLAPREIAERSGAPLNTVKARLARGLERLRGAMDRRYGDDRRAWCHWLTVLGAPPVPVPVPGLPGSAAGAGAGAAGSSILPWVGVAVLVAAGGWLGNVWFDAPRGSGPTPGTELHVEGVHSSRLEVPATEADAEAHAPADEASGPARVSVGSVPRRVLDRVSTAPARAAEPLPEPPLAPFDWPQFAGGPEHDNYRKREDGIVRPGVRWFFPWVLGTPSLRDGDLYTGGTLLRLDPGTGELRAAANEALAKFVRTYVGSRRDPAAIFETLLRSGEALEVLQGAIEFGPAPLVTPRAVIVRRAADGAVVAFDRTLQRELWCTRIETDSGEPPESAQIPLCYAEDGIVLAARSREVVALSASDGFELWRHAFNGRTEMVPACTKGRVIFGMDRGVLYALSARTGEEVWTASGGTFAAMPPVVVGSRVLVADRGELPWNRRQGSGTSTGAMHLRAFDIRSGDEAWRIDLTGELPSGLGLGRSGRFGYADLSGSLARVELAAGRISKAPRLPLAGTIVGSPCVVGDSLVFACNDRHLYVHDLETLERRWSFHVQDADILDFVHAGRRLYVATTAGLFCLGDDPEGPEPGPDCVLAASPEIWFENTDPGTDR